MSNIRGHYKYLTHVSALFSLMVSRNGYKSGIITKFLCEECSGRLRVTKLQNHLVCNKCNKDMGDFYEYKKRRDMDYFERILEGKNR